MGLEALLKGFGISLPSGSLVFEARTVIVGLVVGVGVTVVSAISPARRAVRIPPVAASRLTRADSRSLLGRRGAIGGGCRRRRRRGARRRAGRPAIALVGLGAVGIFIGVGMLAPMVARPMASVIGRPAGRACLGISGRLGRENSMRSPRRTAQTAAALMVGLALVSAMPCSVRRCPSRPPAASTTRSAPTSSSPAPAAAGSRNSVVDGRLRTCPGSPPSRPSIRASSSSGARWPTVTGVSTDHLADTVILQMQPGVGAPALAAGQLLIDTTTANDDHLSVGSSVPVKFALTGNIAPCASAASSSPTP